jgi:hypothetical protein
MSVKNPVDYQDESLCVPFSIALDCRNSARDWRNKHGSSVIRHLREVG